MDSKHDEGLDGNWEHVFTALYCKISCVYNCIKSCNACLVDLHRWIVSRDSYLQVDASQEISVLLAPFSHEFESSRLRANCRGLGVLKNIRWELSSPAQALTSFKSHPNPEATRLEFLTSAFC